MSQLLSRLQAALADRYRVERDLGRGGMAIAYLAEDLKHALTGTLLIYRLACVQARVGRHADAVVTLRTLLTLPYYVSPAWLRLDPSFAPLRDHPEFRHLL